MIRRLLVSILCNCLILSGLPAQQPLSSRLLRSLLAVIRPDAISIETTTGPGWGGKLVKSCAHLEINRFGSIHNRFQFPWYSRSKLKGAQDASEGVLIHIVVSIVFDPSSCSPPGHTYDNLDTAGSIGRVIIILKSSSLPVSQPWARSWHGRD